MARIETAVKEKEQGNTYFKQGDFKKAAYYYHRVSEFSCSHCPYPPIGALEPEGVGRGASGATENNQ